ncbi:MAG TPA: FBP domain-containing protein [Nocardioides sp.]|jgi:hypothetical protein
MEPLTEPEIRASFVNCTKGEAKRAGLPDLDEVPWQDLDFLGWADPSGSNRAYLVLRRVDGPVGLLLRQSSPSDRTVRRTKLCQVCVTQHSGDAVCLAVAPKTGAAGKKGDSTGLYMCRDLACSLYARGKRVPSAATIRETLTLEARVERVREQLDVFVNRVLAG